MSFQFSGTTFRVYTAIPRDRMLEILGGKKNYAGFRFAYGQTTQWFEVDASKVGIAGFLGYIVVISSQTRELAETFSLKSGKTFYVLAKTFLDSGMRALLEPFGFNCKFTTHAGKPAYSLVIEDAFLETVWAKSQEIQDQANQTGERKLNGIGSLVQAHPKPVGDLCDGEFDIESQEEAEEVLLNHVEKLATLVLQDSKVLKVIELLEEVAPVYPERIDWAVQALTSNEGVLQYEKVEETLSTPVELSDAEVIQQELLTRELAVLQSITDFASQAQKAKVVLNSLETVLQNNPENSFVQRMSAQVREIYRQAVRNLVRR